MLALARTAAKIVDWAFVGLFKAPVNAGNSASEFAELAKFARFLAEPASFYNQLVSNRC